MPDDWTDDEMGAAVLRGDLFHVRAMAAEAAVARAIRFLEEIVPHISGYDSALEPEPALDPIALRRLHLDAVALCREFPDLVGPRVMTNCPHDHQGEPRSALATFMRQNIGSAT